MKVVRFFGVALSLCWVSLLSAAPWVDTSDIYLRSDIQALADAGVITVPTNTFPLMWSGIGADLAKVEPELLTPSLTQAFARVNFYYRNAVRNRGNTSIQATVATDPARFQHFGSDYREQGEVVVTHEYMGTRFAAKGVVSANYDPQDDKEIRFDGSYLAGVFGNWIVTAGAIEQWWGPGFDSALHKSNNARPMTSLSVSRNNASAFETPWLSWIGPWTLTTGLSIQEAERAVPKALVWNFRSSIRPIKQIELGVSWTTQFCGEGQDCGWGSWLDAVSGDAGCPDGASSCAPSEQTNLGNQQSGFDIRYSDLWLGLPIGLYLEYTCEDTDGDAWGLQDCGNLMGADTRFHLAKQQYKLFFEYSNTQVNCDSSATAYNCFYEDERYQSGARYYQRALGSTYDSDARTYVLGLVGQFSNSHGLTALMRYAELNRDGTRSVSTWAPQLSQEDLLMLELAYRMPVWHGMLTLGATAYRSEFVTGTTETDGTFFSRYEYRF